MSEGVSVDDAVERAATLRVNEWIERARVERDEIQVRINALEAERFRLASFIELFPVYFPDLSQAMEASRAPQDEWARSGPADAGDSGLKPPPMEKR